MQKKNIIIISTIAAVIILVLSGYLIIRTRLRQPAEDEKTSQQIENAGTPVKPEEEIIIPAKPPAPKEIFSYQGRVVKIEKDGLSLITDARANYLDKETIVSVKINANTQIVRDSMPSVIPKEGGRGLIKQENIALTDISENDMVTVWSETNIKNQTEFTASRIEVIE